MRSLPVNVSFPDSPSLFCLPYIMTLHLNAFHFFLQLSSFLLSSLLFYTVAGASSSDLRSEWSGGRSACAR